MSMNKYRLAATAFLATIAFSGAVFAAQHRYEVVGEGIGHDRDEAYEAASYDASRKCYLSWGRSTQEQTILIEEQQPDTGYWYVKLTEGCISED